MADDPQPQAPGITAAIQIALRSDGRVSVKWAVPTRKMAALMLSGAVQAMAAQFQKQEQTEQAVDNVVKKLREN